MFGCCSRGGEGDEPGGVGVCWTWKLRCIIAIKKVNGEVLSIGLMVRSKAMTARTGFGQVVVESW